MKEHEKTFEIGERSLDFLDALGKGHDKVQVTAANEVKTPFKEALNYCGHLFHQTQERNKKLIFIGNGGSSAIASHQAVDYWKNGKLKAMSFNDASLLTCISNDYGFEHVFSEPIKRFADEGDVLIAISSSGQSKNILNAVAAAREAKCHAITFSGFNADNPLRKTGRLNFYVPSGNYGLVEVLHLSLLHAMLDSYMSFTQKYDMGLTYGNV